MVKKTTRLREKARAAAKAPATPGSPSCAPPPDDAPPPPSHIRAKILKRLSFFDRATAAAAKAAPKRPSTKTPATATAAAALLSRPIGSVGIVKGTRLGLSPSSLRRAKRKAKAAAVGAALGSLGGLAAAVEAAATARPPPTPNFSRGKVRMAVAAAETARLGAVLAHEGFASDPIAAIGAHLAATAPPVAPGRERAKAGTAAAAAAADPERLRQQRIRRRREAKKRKGGVGKRVAMEM